MVRILVVDDEPGFTKLLTMELEAEGMECQAANSGEEALRLLAAAPRGHFDLILLDIEMPGMSGLDLLYELREVGEEVPVMFVSALDATTDKVKGLRTGADDYLTKPYELPELLARIDAVLRRRQAPFHIEFGDLDVDPIHRRAKRGGAAVNLTPREFDLLLALVDARGEVVHRTVLLKRVWNLGFDPGTNLVDVQIGRLRKKLDQHGPPLIVNERGTGYRLQAQSAQVT